MLRFRNPLRHGRWLAWLIHDMSIPDDDVPSARDLAYRVRRAKSVEVDHFYSESTPGVTPCLEVWLLRLDAVTWTGQPKTLWRTEAVVHLLAGVHPAGMTRSRSFAHEENARADFDRLCTMRSQICDPPDEDWVNPAPWRHNAVYFGHATCWFYPPDPQDLSGHYWLSVLGVELMVRRRHDGTYVHFETDALAGPDRPLIVEVDNSGPNYYGDPQGTSDD